MCFNTSFRAAHGRCSFCNVHLFPVTHEEGFSLTCGELFNLKFYDFQDLGASQLVLAAFAALSIVGNAQGFQQVEIAPLGV